MPEVSVIIPVYNCEGFIGKTLESIIDQVYTDFEIVLVDDGSTDNSAKIIEAYAEKDPRIHLIKQDNAGVSCARNKGIENCNGKYIAFCDADDLYLPTTLQALTNAIKAKDYDWVISGYERVYFKEDGQEKIPVRRIICSEEKNSYNSRKEIVSNLKTITEINKAVTLPPLFNTLWNKLYKASIIKENNILFPEKIPMGEDYRFNLSYLNCISSLTVTDDIVYLYYINSKSATFKFRESDFDIRSETIEITEKFFQENGYEIPEETKRLFVKLVYSMFANMHLKSNKNTHKENKAFFLKILNNAKVKDVIASYSPKAFSLKLSVTLLKTRNYLIIMAFSYFLYWLRNRS